MYIKEIQMEGFKCYQQKTVIRNIGPGFNAITGMNGSGKSNIIDAILFCLGFDTPKLMRIQSLKDLVNVHSTQCTVTIIFQNDAQSPAAYKSLSEISLTRIYDGKSKYKMNNTTCTLTTITKFLESVNLGSSAYFTVLQGHITKVLNMRKEDLDCLIEETAGIRAYEAKKVRALEYLDKKEMKLKEAKDNLTARISPFVHKLKDERDKYKNTLDALVRKKRCTQREAKIRGLLVQNTLFVLKNQILKALKEYDEEKRELGDVESRLAEIRDNDDVNLLDLRNELEQEIKRIEDLGIEETRQELAKKEHEVAKMHAKSSCYEDLRIKEGVLVEELAKSKKDGFLRMEEISAKKGELAKIRNELEHAGAQGSDSDAKDPAMIQRRIAEIERLRPVGLDELRTRLDSYKRSLHYPLIKGVLGSVEENFTVKEHKYEEAVLTILGNRGKFVIVENDQIATQMLRDSERKLSVIPLNRIKSSHKVLDAGTQKGSVVRMVDVISFKEEVRNAMEFVFGNFYIVEDKDVAKHVAFKSQVVCVLLDGTIYDPKGTLSTGRVRIEKFTGLNVADVSAQLAALEKNAEAYNSAQDALRVLQEALQSTNCVAELRLRAKNLEYAIYAAESGQNLKEELAKLREKLLAEHNVHKENVRQTELKKKMLAEIGKLTNLLDQGLASKATAERKIASLELSLREKEIRQSIKGSNERICETLENKQKFLMKSILKNKGLVNRLNKEFVEKYSVRQELAASAETSNLPPGVDADLFREFCVHSGVSESFERAESEEQLAKELEIVTAEIKSLDRIKDDKMNPKNFEFLEKNEMLIKSLEEKIGILESDKVKIQRSIERLSALSRKEKQKAFEHLNKNIGKFLRYFIKDADAQITDECELKIKTGSSWKENLDELSGGQRSLAALSLIFAMLAYNPAPFYVFDEIDSALDMNYTQSIGRIIRNEFKSQFVLVSLKNEMVENAEHVFRVVVENSVATVKQIK